jgi:hypothetical protein
MSSAKMRRCLSPVPVLLYCGYCTPYYSVCGVILYCIALCRIVPYCAVLCRISINPSYCKRGLESLIQHVSLPPPLPNVRCNIDEVACLRTSGQRRRSHILGKTGRQWDMWNLGYADRQTASIITSHTSTTLPIHQQSSPHIKTAPSDILMLMKSPS